jgi:hypothetical protein
LHLPTAATSGSFPAAAARRGASARHRLCARQRAAIGGLHGQWEVEGAGIAPDIDVQQDPRAVREGRDPQLDAAVATALQLLREHPIPTYRRPPYPDHHPVLPSPGS